MSPFRKTLLTGIVAVTLSTVPVYADVTNSVLRQLSDQGYSVQSVQRTLLGRTRVISTRDDLRRETVFDPRSGVILRDLARRGGGQSGLAGLFGGSNSQSDDGDRSSSSSSGGGGFGGGGSSQSGGGSQGGDDEDSDDEDSGSDSDEGGDDSDDGDDDSDDGGDDDSDDGDDGDDDSDDE